MAERYLAPVGVAKRKTDPRYASRGLPCVNVVQNHERKDNRSDKKTVFAGLDIDVDTIAAAVADLSAEVPSLGVLPNRPEPVRNLVHKVGAAIARLLASRAHGVRLVLAAGAVGGALAESSHRLLYAGVGIMPEPFGFTCPCMVRSCS
jgi:hypothetical protein